MNVPRERESSCSSKIKRRALRCNSGGVFIALHFIFNFLNSISIKLVSEFIFTSYKNR